MKIRLLSDLHTEFCQYYKQQPYFEYNNEDVLVLAGDIASGSTNTTEVIKNFKKAGFKDVVYVPGNHEYYGTAIADFDAKMHSKCAKLKDVWFLNPGWVKIKDVIFIGAALWTNFRNNPLAELSAKDMISDFRLINDFYPYQAVEMFNQHFKHLKKVVEMFPTEKKVFVTHFLPATECISPRFSNLQNLLNNYFSNDLGSWIETLENSTWLFGHTHDSVDITIGTTRLISNPYGYFRNETNPNFKPNFVV